MNPAEIVWNFPGGATAFGIAAGAALVLAALLYCFTLRKLKLRQRLLLGALRLALLLALLALLGNPRREETREYVNEKTVRLGVVFDVSSSMCVNGLLGSSRLADSLRQFEEAARPEGKVEYRYFTIGERLEPAASAESIRPLAGASSKRTVFTNLLDSLRDGAALFDSQNLDAVVVFTDGVDTSDAQPAPALSALAGSRPQYRIVPAVTELAMHKFLEFRKVEAPARAVQNATVPVDIAASYSNLTGSDKVELAITDDRGSELFRAEGKRNGAGGGMMFRAELTMDAPGLRRYTAALLLNGRKHRETVWCLETVKRNRKRILLYQGTHDWAARFLKNAVASENRSELEVRRFNAELPNNNFPSDRELAEYDVVILLNLNRKQCVGSLEKSLHEYLKAGGGVIFVTGNPVIAGEYANSPLEMLLPVEFSPNLNRSDRKHALTSQFRREIRNYHRGVNGGAEQRFLRAQEFSYKPTRLKEFTLTPAGEAGPMFRLPGGGEIRPGFLDCAKVDAVKPGAQALAFYKDEKGAEHIILAVQRFGRGRSVVLATDPLWRWKLSLPSDRRDSEIFWENLLSFAGDAGKLGDQPWTLGESQPVAGKPLKLRLSQPEVPADCTVSCEKESWSLTFQPVSGKAGLWESGFTPARPGIYRLRSGDGAVRDFTVAADRGNRELDAPAPNLFLLRQFGALDNCRVLAPAEKLDLSDFTALKGETLTERIVRPLWPTGTLLALLLALYCCELILRRIFKLV
ncbi:hypothetical protein [Victivallis vadensis]|uniref:hypothetical protein n=1 Tax=Victivallis vadensis TaxID=172901 RepID=UPI0026DD13EF|nr:hypothetical protein [Victivallis vadensis]